MFEKILMKQLPTQTERQTAVKVIKAKRPHHCSWFGFVQSCDRFEFFEYKTNS
jgi:hypothetical protein